MKKIIMTIAVLFTAASIALACGENCKKACCKKDEKTATKACAGKEEKSCAKAKSCCKNKAKAAEATLVPADQAAPAQK
jgi:hypothetical protein